MVQKESIIDFDLAERILEVDEEGDFHKIKDNIKVDIELKDFLNKKINDLFYIAEHKDKKNIKTVEDKLNYIKNSYLKTIVAESNEELFDAILESFENLTKSNISSLYTHTLRSILLYMFEEKEVENKEKIEKICRNEILTKKDNFCDNVMEEESIFPDTRNFYYYYFPVAVKTMSLFYENEEIIDKIYPDKEHHNIIAEKYEYLHLEQYLKEKKIGQTVAKKLGDVFIQEVYIYANNNNSTHKEDTLDMILNIYGDNINTHKKLILMNLVKLDFEKVQEVIHKYPLALKAITKKEVEDFQVGNAYVCHEDTRALKKYNIPAISIFDLNSLNHTFNNFLKIVNCEQIELEKKEIEESIITPNTPIQSIKKKRI